MIRLLIIFLLLATQASAQIIPGASNFKRTCLGGGAFCAVVPLAPTRIFDFTLGTLPNGFTFTRSSAGNYFNSSGYLASAANDTARYDYGIPGSSTLYGLLIEAAATNLLLNNRDLTNPVWTQVTATVAMDQTGIDNVSNSASSFTALGANSTVCQAITQAATNDTFSVYLKRLGGTGNVAISQDGGASYATVTLNGSWQRFIHLAQSVANPQVCIRIATNGDQIAMDYAQLETNNLAPPSNKGYATSPILTTSTTASRSADVLSMPKVSPTGITDSTNRWVNLNSGAFVVEWQQYSFNSALTTVSLGGSTSLNISNNNTNMQIAAANCGTSNPFVPATPIKAGTTYGSKFFASSITSTHCSPTTSNPTVFNALSFGGNLATMWLRKYTYWNHPLTTAQLQALTL